MSPSNNTNNLSNMHCVLNHKMKIKAGISSTLTQDVILNCGSYIFQIEDTNRKSIIKSHNFALGEILITTENGEKEILKSAVDFRKEHPFTREIRIPPQEDGANDGQDEKKEIKFYINISSLAHLKTIKLQSMLLSANETPQAQILSSQTLEKKRNEKEKERSNGSSDERQKSSPFNSISDLNSSFSSTGSKRFGSISSNDSFSLNEDENESDELTVKETDTSVVEKDVLIIEKNTTYTSEGVEQNKNVQIHVEHTKTTEVHNKNITEVKAPASPKLKRLSGKFSSSTGSLPGTSTGTESTISGSDGDSNSQTSFDPSEENLVYYKDIKLKRKHVHAEQIPIQQKGKYYLVIENMDKGPINRHFSCHLTVCNSTSNHVLKESFTKDAKKKINDDFVVDTESAHINLELANINTSFGSTELQLSLYMRNTPQEQTDTKVHRYLRTGEVVWSVNGCEVEKKRPEKHVAKITSSGAYYIVVEKVDKIYGGLREIAVTAALTEPVKECRITSGETEKAEKSDEKENVKTKTSEVATIVVGGTKKRPMKWKSPIFIAPAGSTIEFNVESYALVGNIIYSLRVRKLPGYTAEEVKVRRGVFFFLAAFGIYYMLYILMAIMHFIQNIGITFRFLFISIDITLGRLCFVFFIAWCRENNEILTTVLKDVRDTIRKIIRKIKYIQDMSDGGKFDILRIFKQMSKEGKANDRKKWEKQKLLTANE